MFILLFALGVRVYADSIDVETAGFLAKKFYLSIPDIGITKSQINVELAYAALENSRTANDTDAPLYYVFNINQKDGYVIIAADDDVSPILSYALKGHYTNTNLPPAYIEWMNKYKAEISFVKENQLKADKKIRKEWADLIDVNNAASGKSLNEVAPLLATTWGQGAYYNDLCPYNILSFQNTLTGCVATAMAQIMKKWNYPLQGNGNTSYNCPFYGPQTANFGATTYDWLSMPDSILSDNIAIATLMYHCGVSVSMDYGLNVSNAYPTKVDYALVNYFNYSPAILEIFRSICSDEEWMLILKSNLDLGRPVLYAGYNPISGSGHAFVCDGYDNLNLFHFNWGWSGSCDDFFNLSALNPGTSTFNSNQLVFANIEPSPSVGLPIVSTTAITNVTESGATSGGYVVSEAGSPVTVKGICWSTSQNPTIADSNTSDGTGVGVFNSTLAGLTAGITYYVRAYATNITGTAYGNQISFTTLSSTDCWKKVGVGKFDSEGFVLGLTYDGKLFAWGDNGDGQLGIGNYTYQSIPAQVIGNNWKTFAVGGEFAIAIKNNGTLWAWGYNGAGQLGNGTSTSVNSPVQIGSANDWKEVVAGNSHVFAIKNNGTLWAAGSNGSGQIGDGTTTNKTIFVQIGADTNWMQVAAGNNFSAAVKQDGTLWTWGNNSSGQCGNGSYINVLIPTVIGSGCEYVSAGRDHVLALMDDGTLWAWGLNGHGELGHDNGSSNIPTQEETGSNDWQKISAGFWHNTAIKNDGSLWVWGRNWTGALGLGYTQTQLSHLHSPYQSGTSLDWKDINNGGINSTATKNDGSLYLWGDNSNGQIGNGTYDTQITPLMINCATYPPVVNDNCPGAISLVQNLTCIPISGTTINATQSTPAILCGGNTGAADDDVWFKFIALSTNPTIVVAGGPNFDAVLELLSGACNGINISCADVSGDGGTETIIATGLTIGVTYYILVYSYASGINGNFTICVYGTPPPSSNDNSMAAIVVSQNNTCTPGYGSTLNSTQSNDINTCGGNADDDVWFSFVAHSETPIITVVGANLFDPVVELLNINSENITCSNATRNGGTEIINAIGLEIDTTYFVRVYSFGTGTAGTFSLCVSGSFTTSDIPDIEGEKIFRVYPNPVSNECILEFIGNSKNVNYEIFNSVGQLVLKGNLLEKTIVPTSTFASGVYLLKLNTGTKIELKKIVKE